MKCTFLPIHLPPGPHTSLPLSIPLSSHTCTHALQTLKWNFPLPRSEHVEQLKEQLQPCVSSTLFTQLFHDDFKHHLTALATLTKVGGVCLCLGIKTSTLRMVLSCWLQTVNLLEITPPLSSYSHTCALSPSTVMHPPITKQLLTLPSSY